MQILEGLSVYKSEEKNGIRSLPSEASGLALMFISMSNEEFEPFTGMLVDIKGKEKAEEGVIISTN